MDDFVLMRPIHYPDGTEAKELLLYPGIEKLLVDSIRNKIDEEKKEGKS